MAAFTDGNIRASQIFAANSMKITKLKVKKGQKISKGCLLCFYKDDNDTLQRFKSHEIGTITDVFVKDGDDVDKGTALFAWEGCNHPTVMKDMCADCGADLRVENSTAGNRKEEVSASVAMVHSIPELIVSEQYAKELGKADEERLLKTRKLVLLVDLDQTLIHTTNDNIPANLRDVHHYQLWHGKQLLWYHTRLRPHTQSFLEKISTLFELHICTFGSRIYAHTIAKIIDPEGKYFSHRILSRDECFNAQAKTANLKALFPNGDSMVCIIDDREDVWHFSPNLIHVKPYRFFQGTADINAPPGLTKTEQDSEPMVHRVRKVSVSSTGSNEDKSEKDISENSEENNEGKSNDSKNGPTVEDKVSDLKDGKTIENDNEDSNESKNNGDNEKSESPMEVEGEGDLKTAISASDDPIETDGGDKTKVKESDKNSDSNIVDSSKGSAENNEKQIVDDSAVKDYVSDKKSAESKAENKNDVDEKSSGDKAIDKKDETNEQEEELIEWDDEDDYLLHLEEILKNIHSTFYKFQDDFVKKQSDKSDDSDKTNVDDGTAPSLKNLIPYIKKKVLNGCNLVFSGVIPTNMTPEKSRAYIVAKSLGATVQTEFRTKENEKDSKNFTTHLVAARAGTQKVRTAIKYKHINKVNADWLWSCVERWERVEEVLFPLTALLECEQGRDSPDIIEQQKKAASKRKRPYNSDSDKNKSESKRSKQNGKDVDDDDADNADDVDNESDKKPDNFAMSYNPMLAFSDDDLAYMDKEVENELESDDDDASSEEDDVREERIRNQVLKKVPELVESSSDDSLCADLPRGWGLRKKMSPRSSSDDEMKGSDSPERVDISPEYESETDQDKFDKIMDAFSPESENTDDDDAESVGSVDEEIAEAVMKEFLS